MWVLHKPQECKNRLRSKVENDQNDKTDDWNNSEQAMPEIIEDKRDNNDSDLDDSETP